MLCVGEVIVDLICEGRLSPGEPPRSFVPHPGGALANVAVAVSRHGMAASMAGGVGDEHWGAWLREGLEAEGVATDCLATVIDIDTPLGIVLFDELGEPSFQIYGEHISDTMLACRPLLGPAIDQAGAVVVGSNTMVGEVEREVTRHAVEIAHENGIPVLFDPNHRPNRWKVEDRAREFCLELAGGSALIKCNRGEAALMTGESEALDAARILAASGPRLAVVTDGAGPVVTAGAAEEVFTPEDCAVTSPLGAGDAFMGALAAGLALRSWDFRRIAEVLPEATAAGSAACGHWRAQA